MGSAHAHNQESNTSDSAPPTLDLQILMSPWKKVKIKHKDKFIITEKGKALIIISDLDRIRLPFLTSPSHFPLNKTAAHSIATVVGSLKKGKVFALDLPTVTLKRLTEMDISQEEDIFRKAFETTPSAQREWVFFWFPFLSFHSQVGYNTIFMRFPFFFNADTSSKSAVNFSNIKTMRICGCIRLLTIRRFCILSERVRRVRGGHDELAGFFKLFVLQGENGNEIVNYGWLVGAGFFMS